VRVGPAIDRAFFREAPDGTIVFFPWGLARQGHRLPDEAARRKAARAVSLLVAAAVATGAWAASALQPFVEREGQAGALLGALARPLAALALALVVYALWAARFVEALPASDLRVSREERLRDAAAVADPRIVALVGAATCGLGAFALAQRPHAWWLGGLGIALGAGALRWSRVAARGGRGAPGAR